MPVAEATVAQAHTPPIASDTPATACSSAASICRGLSDRTRGIDFLVLFFLASIAQPVEGELLSRLQHARLASAEDQGAAIACVSDLELARQTRIDRHTIAKAIERLADCGLICVCRRSMARSSVDWTRGGSVYLLQPGLKQALTADILAPPDRADTHPPSCVKNGARATPRSAAQATEEECDGVPAPRRAPPRGAPDAVASPAALTQRPAGPPCATLPDRCRSAAGRALPSGNARPAPTPCQPGSSHASIEAPTNATQPTRPSCAGDPPANERDAGEGPAATPQVAAGTSVNSVPSPGGAPAAHATGRRGSRRAMPAAARSRSAPASTGPTPLNLGFEEEEEEEDKDNMDNEEEEGTSADVALLERVITVTTLEFGPVTPYIRALLQRLVSQHPHWEDWDAAFQAAARANVRRLDYIESVLRDRSSRSDKRIASRRPTRKSRPAGSRASNARNQRAVPGSGLDSASSQAGTDAPTEAPLPPP